MRITAKAETEEQALALIEAVEKQVVDRLGNWIYGTDQDTLEQVALRNIHSKGWTLAVLESGLKGELLHMLATDGGPFIGGEISTVPLSPEDLVRWMENHPLRQHAKVILGAALHPRKERQEIFLACHTPEEERLIPLSYGGPPGYASTWAANQGLDLLRKL